MIWRECRQTIHQILIEIQRSQIMPYEEVNNACILHQRKSQFARCCLAPHSIKTVVVYFGMLLGLVNTIDFRPTMAG